MEWSRIEVVVSSSTLEYLLCALVDESVGAILEEDLPDAQTRLIFAVPDGHDAGALVNRLGVFLSSRGQQSDIQIRTAREPDWSQAWKSSFHPICISEGFWVRPSWETLPAEATGIEIEIDPGKAFGVGSHETTRLCLRALKRLSEERPLGSILDVETGSGILAIAAARLGANAVTAIDTDRFATEAAAENILRNRVGDVVSLSPVLLQDLDECYDVVIANLTAADLTALASPLCARAARHGALVLSGILAGEQADEVQDQFAQRGFPEASTEVEGEWAVVVLRRGE
ncbi:MAG: 50S ribosomal protein L11 methyltransferase [Acidobacteriota bacterium]